MREHNRDLFPTRETLALYAAIEPLVSNPIVDKPFLLHEKLATTNKRSYHFQGRLGISLVVLSALFTAADALILQPILQQFAWRHELSAAMIVAGGCGIVIQLRLLITRRKQNWLLNRFAAERLRSIKFQAYPLADAASDARDLSRMVDEFYAKETAQLSMEINARDAALTLFSPRAAVRELYVPTGFANTEIASLARDAYKDLRIAYQRRFAADELGSLRTRQRVGYASADVLYICGAALTFVALVSKMAFDDKPSVLSSWIDFVALAAFILALSNSLLENASLNETSQVRYEQYIRDLDDRERELKNNDASFGDTVLAIEEVALGELEQFCLAASRISYRL